MRINTLPRVLLVAAAATLVLGGVLAGYLVFRTVRGEDMMGWRASRNPGVYSTEYTGCPQEGGPLGPACQGSAPQLRRSTGSLEESESAFESCVERLGCSDLRLTEAMEFERNCCDIVAGQGAGTCAAELNLDKRTRAAVPEQCPNIMWSAKY